MPKRLVNKQHVHPADLRGASRLAIDATIGLTNLVETMHRNISGMPGILGTTLEDPTHGITGFVYRSIRGVTRAVGGGLDLALGQVVELVKQESPSSAREAVVSALNGVLGDHLVTTGNPMAIPMQMRRDGQPLTLTRKALSSAMPDATGRILVLVHGLCMSDLQWQRHSHDHGAMLATDPAFKTPFTTVYLHYNSGQHISISGRGFAEQLQALIKVWPVPVEDLTIVAHSMGGLVTRSACDYAENNRQSWRNKLRKIIFLGTPHFGAPLERGGNWVNVVLDASPYTAAFARLAKVRSAGITDLRHAGVRDEDWEDQDRFAASHASKTHDLPLPGGVQCYAIAASIGKKSGSAAARMLGDGLVPVHSALGQHKNPARSLAFAKSHQWTGHNMNHMDLLDRKIVYRRIRKWLLD